MPQHDYVISDQSPRNIRTDINAALAAIASGNSAPTAPSPCYALQEWWDTSTTPPTPKRRNADNTAWIVIEPQSVRDYGAGDGRLDDTSAFSAAAQGVPARVNINGPGASLPRAPMCLVSVPAGNYVLTSEVDTGGREVAWVLDQAAVVSGYYFLNGQVLRQGERQSGFHHGTTDYACGYSIKSNSDLAEGAAVLGITDANQLGAYSDRDSVSLYVDNLAPAANVDVNAATYTSTSVTIAAQNVATVRKYRRGMIIDTKHSPKWSGFVDSWNADGSVIAVTGWYRNTGSVGAAGTPANGTGCVINGFTKVWAHNANLFLTSNSHARRATGFELGTFNNKGALDYAAQTNYIWGFDSVNLGTFEGAAAFIARNSPAARWFRGYECEDASQVAFHAGGNPGVGFWSEQLSGAPFRFTRGVVDYFTVDFNGNIRTLGVLTSEAPNGALTLGSRTAVNTPFVNFNSSGVTNDFDCRIIASGGSATTGAGQLTIQGAAGIRFAGDIFADTPNFFSLGRSNSRWGSLFAGIGDFSGDVRSAGVLQSNVLNGSVTLGLRTAASTPFINFYSSGSSSDFDARIIASGGSATTGAGLLTIQGTAGIRFAGAIYPETDNAVACGLTTNRWTVIRAATGTIATSDKREKQDILKISATEKRVAQSLKGLMRRYKRRDAVEEKGERARLHFGVIAQDVIAAFAKEGLDAGDYGILCYDEWEEQQEIKDEDLGIISPYQAAGNRYGIRYDELFAFIIAAL